MYPNYIKHKDDKIQSISINNFESGDIVQIKNYWNNKWQAVEIIRGLQTARDPKRNKIGYLLELLEPEEI